MKSKEEKITADPYRRMILASAIILFLLGLCLLLVNISGVLTLDFSSIINAISALSIIIGAIGATKKYKWGLGFLGFSIIFPVLVFLVKDPNALYTSVFFEIINLIIFIHIFMLFQAFHCKDESKKERLIRLSKKYLFYMLTIFMIALAIIVFNVLACAFGGSGALGITKLLTLNGFIDKVQALKNLSN